MEQAKIDRINELTALARQRELTVAETAEREQLRAEYIADWRNGAKATLDNTFIIGPDGMKRRLKKK